MPTIRELITGSLRLINVVQVNEVPTAADIDTGFSALNSMLDSWSTERLTIFTMNPYLFAVIPSKKDYTLGPGGDWDVVRPMELLMLYVRYTTDGIQTDIPMEKLTMEQYSMIGVKNTVSVLPLKYYDDGNYPKRNITVWPVPTQTRPVVAWLWQPLVDPTSLDQQLEFPLGYERALRFALAQEIAPEFGKAVPDDIRQIAQSAKSTIKRINSTPQIMRGDQAIASSRTSLFNYILGDTVATNI